MIGTGVAMLVFMACYIVFTVLYILDKVPYYPMELLSLLFATYILWFIVWVIRNSTFKEKKWKFMLTAVLLWQVFNTGRIAVDLWQGWA